MIETISLSNFKGFRKLDALSIKPITILCGTNSCGKSSILQSILLLKQTLESQSPSQTILLNGRYAHLGTFENLIYGKDPANSIEFGLKLRLSRDTLRRPFGRRDLPLKFMLRNLLGRRDTTSGDAEYQLTLNTRFRQEARKSSRAPAPIRVDQYRFELSEVTLAGLTSKVSCIATRQEDALYRIELLNFPQRLMHGDQSLLTTTVTAKLEFTNLVPSEIRLKNASDTDDAAKQVTTAFYWVFQSLHQILRGVFSSYTYIGPLREEPSRRYIYEDEIVELGIKGENAAYIYLAEQEESADGNHFYDPATDGFTERPRERLGKAVRDWLDQMGIREFQPERVGELIYLSLDASTPNTRVSIADVGFGVSQIFPIILEGLRMPKESTLLLEQPEIHLHPNLQMRLADYFIALALSGKRVIVETHSDHIVNRLVRRIVEDRNGRMAQLIGIHFITPSDAGSMCQEVKVDPDRGIVNWPNDFFDQAATEQERIIRACLRKSMANRQSSAGVP